jgi:hypothetical protein
MPGIENISVKIKTSENVPRLLLNSVVENDKQMPLKMAFSNAAKIQMVKLKKIDLTRCAVKRQGHVLNG